MLRLRPSCLDRDETSSLISAGAFVKLRFQSGLTASCDQYSVFIILTLIVQPGRGGAWGMVRERDRRGSGGECKYCWDASAPPYSGNVWLDIPWILSPVKYEQAKKKKRNDGWDVLEVTQWIIKVTGTLHSHSHEFHKFWILPSRYVWRL